MIVVMGKELEMWRSKRGAGRNRVQSQDIPSYRSMGAKAVLASPHFPKMKN